MPWIVSGNRNHCGVCCLSISLGGFMRENPYISLGEDRCKLGWLVRYELDTGCVGTGYTFCR